MVFEKKEEEEEKKKNAKLLHVVGLAKLANFADPVSDRDDRVREEEPIQTSAGWRYW